jgi:hypothetical protein
VGGDDFVATDAADFFFEGLDREDWEFDVENGKNTSDGIVRAVMIKTVSSVCGG